MKALYFIILMLAILGFIGGIGYILWVGNSYPIALGILALGFLAYPKAREYFKYLLG